MKAKLTSRKLWVALIGVLTGIVLIVSGTTTEGVATVITSILGYLITEGYIDAKAVNAIIDQVEDQMEETTE